MPEIMMMIAVMAVCAIALGRAVGGPPRSVGYWERDL